MKVVIMGSGNVATAMGRTIVAAGHTVVQVAGRNEAAVTRLAAEWRSGHTTEWKAIDREADLYIVSLADRALAGLGGQVTLPGRLVVHTAGALPAATLNGVSERTGVLYPLQSFRNGTPLEFPLLVDAVRPEDLPVIMRFASTLAGKVVHTDDATRLKLHVAAVLVNNFTNHLYTLASDLCRQEQTDFTLLLPLIRETAQRIERVPPQEVQTGPAIRGDRNTVEKHLQILSKYRGTKELYELFTILIEEYYRRKQSPGSGWPPLE